MACRNCYKYPFCDKCSSPKGHCEDEKPKRIMQETLEAKKHFC